MKTFRQGDLLLVQVDEIDTQKLEKSKTGIIALGEVTGHKHVVRGADVYTTKETPFWGEIIDAANGATITHEEHGPITLEPGKYKIIHQREYVAKDLERSVID